MDNIAFWWLKAVVVVTVLLTATGVVTLYSAEQPASPIIQSEVVQKDSLGRVEVMETRAGNGTCIAQITRDNNDLRIHVVVIARAQMRNLGFLELKDGIDDAILERVFNWAIETYCLPLIVKGYVKI